MILFSKLILANCKLFAGPWSCIQPVPTAMSVDRRRPLEMFPIPSMGLVYLPTWMVDFYAKCREIYHTWIVWVWFLMVSYEVNIWQPHGSIGANFLDVSMVRVILLMVQKSGKLTSWYGSLSHFLLGFINPQVVFSPDFWTIGPVSLRFPDLLFFFPFGGGWDDKVLLRLEGYLPNGNSKIRGKNPPREEGVPGTPSVLFF